jgi:hypothetical protein
MKNSELFESIKKSIPRRDHDKHALVGHYKALNRGKWQGIEWRKGDVGEYSNPFKDRHNLLSVYIRFKGMKSVKAIPAVMFRRFFEPTTDSQVDEKKWANADKGGTKVKIKKTVVPDAPAEKKDGAGNKKETVRETEIMAGENIVESLIVEEVRYSISKVGDRYQLRKYMGDNTKNYFIMATNSDVKVLQARLKSIRDKNKTAANS